MKKNTLLKLFLSSFFVASCWFSPRIYAYTAGPIGRYSLSASSGNEIGTVNISWYDDGSTKDYRLTYGPAENAGDYELIHLNHKAGTISYLNIGSLNPGQTYYFKLYGIKDGTDDIVGPVAAIATSQTTQQTATSDSANSNAQITSSYAFTAKTGATPGTIEISWLDNATANGYSLVYGPKAGQYLYGWENMPYQENMLNQQTIGALQSGQRYYFALVSKRDNQVIQWSAAISAKAK